MIVTYEDFNEYDCDWIVVVSWSVIASLRVASCDKEEVEFCRIMGTGEPESEQQWQIRGKGPNAESMAERFQRVICSYWYDATGHDFARTELGAISPDVPSDDGVEIGVCVAIIYSVGRIEGGIDDNFWGDTENKDGKTEFFRFLVGWTSRSSVFSYTWKKPEGMRTKKTRLKNDYLAVNSSTSSFH